MSIITAIFAVLKESYMYTNEFTFKTGQEMGLTDTEIAAKAEVLMAEALKNAERKCPDCTVSPGHLHNHGCDVATCQTSGKQMLMCRCGDCRPDVWEGLWPGARECYEKKFICYSTRSSWMFDYNTLAIHKSGKH